MTSRPNLASRPTSTLRPTFSTFSTSTSVARSSLWTFAALWSTRTRGALNHDAVALLRDRAVDALNLSLEMRDFGPRLLDFLRRTEGDYTCEDDHQHQRCRHIAEQIGDLYLGVGVGGHSNWSMAESTSEAGRKPPKLDSMMSRIGFVS